MRRLLILTGAVVFLDTLFFSAIAPLLPHYADEFDLSKAAAGVLAGAYPAGTLVAAIPAVLVAMRIGVKGALLLGLGLLAVSSVAFGLGESVVVLDVSRFVQGAGGALCWSGSLAWLVASAPPNRRGELIGASLGLAVGGSLLGPAPGTAAAGVGAGHRGRGVRRRPGLLAGGGGGGWAGRVGGDDARPPDRGDAAEPGRA